jgi:hypothetical protein
VGSFQKPESNASGRNECFDNQGSLDGGRTSTYGGWCFGEGAGLCTTQNKSKRTQNKDDRRRIAYRQFAERAPFSSASNLFENLAMSQRLHPPVAVKHTQSTGTAYSTYCKHLIIWLCWILMSLWAAMRQWWCRSTLRTY